MASPGDLSYLAARSLHVGCVAVSITLFVLRGVLMTRQSALLGTRFLRIAPHVVDTILLAGALWLAALIHQYPLRDNWLTAKLIGLCVYITLGSLALRRGRTIRVRMAAFAAALAVVAWIVSVARLHDPWGFLAG